VVVMAVFTRSTASANSLYVVRNKVLIKRH
jgi:hypothetical protein